MDKRALSFATIIPLRNDIAEVIVDEGVELDLDMVREYHRYLLANFNSPFSLLVNKIHAYTYTFEAQLNLATLEEINVMAVVAYNRATKVSTENLANSIPRQIEWNLRIFNERSSAVSWLVEQQSALSET